MSIVQVLGGELWTNIYAGLIASCVIISTVALVTIAKIMEKKFK